MVGIRSILDKGGMSAYDMIMGPVPTRDEQSEIRCMALCKENRCGQYGRTWACPPGFSGTVDDYSKRFTSVAIVKRTFTVDVGDVDGVSEASHTFQDDIRRMMALIRSSGYDCMGMADGGCTYCGICAYPDPCRFPQMLVPSVSAVGLDLGKYLDSVGEKLEFRSDRVTMYGLLFIR